MVLSWLILWLDGRLCPRDSERRTAAQKFRESQRDGSTIFSHGLLFCLYDHGFLLGAHHWFDGCSLLLRHHQSEEGALRDSRRCICEPSWKMLSFGDGLFVNEQKWKCCYDAIVSALFKEPCEKDSTKQKLSEDMWEVFSMFQYSRHSELIRSPEIGALQTREDSTA